jgi:hypothetical protein
VSGFFSELGKQLADKWLKLLVLPGLLFLTTVLAGPILGHRHAFDVSRAVRRVDTLSTGLQHSGAATAILVASLLLAAGAAGLLANALATVVERLWVGTWPMPLRWPAAWRTKKRLSHWNMLSQEIDRAENPGELMAARARYAYTAPCRPTWMGDRLRGVEAVVHQEYRLDLSSAWPRLWLLLSADTKAELTAARSAFDRATALGGWGVLYCAAGIGWWPAAAAGTVTFVTGLVQAKNRVDVYADLAEAVVDLHIVKLAEALPERPSDGSFHHELGAPITKLLRKGG